jgi:hypothetical protein
MEPKLSHGGQVVGRVGEYGDLRSVEGKVSVGYSHMPIPHKNKASKKFLHSLR